MGPDAARQLVPVSGEFLARDSSTGGRATV
jgi:hypothetical protein